jgi:hypothetical protein
LLDQSLKETAVLRHSFVLALVACLPAACISDSDAVVTDAAAVTSGDDAIYFSIRADMRRCASPGCGGFFIAPVNTDRMTCADGTRKSECYVATLDTEALGLPETDVDPVRSRLFERNAVIVAGNTSRRRHPGVGTFGHLDVSEAWVAGSAAGTTTAPARHGREPRTYPAVLVNLNGVRCIQAPCPDKSEQVLNSRQRSNISDLDFGPSGATDDEVASAWNALTADGLPGLIVFGDRYTVRGTGGARAHGRRVSQIYTRVTAPAVEPLLTVDECESAGGQVRGDIGDGQIACQAGETDLGRVSYGIEGGVCCEPAPVTLFTPDECEAAGGFVRGDIGDGRIACEDTETQLGRVVFGREGGVCCQVN